MFRPVLTALPGLIAALCVSPTACGLATEHIGPDPQTASQLEWGHGLVEVPRHGSRVYSLWVNGNDTFYFDAEPDEVTELVTRFSDVRLRDHVVRLTSGQPVVKSFKGQEFGYNVSLNVLAGIALWHARTHDAKPQTHEPVLTVYVADDAARQQLEAYDWPDNIVIENEIADWELKSKAKQSFRKLLHAAIRFDDDKPAVDFESGMSTTITLWEAGQEHGFDLGKVNREGLFSVAFSLDELARLKNGELWLTMTVGNYLRKATPADPRLDIDSFAFTAEAAKPVTVARSTIHHGQILFEDDSPPILNPLPWPGAEIRVSFPHAGMVSPDADGNFRITLTTDQFNDLKIRKARKNIYIPLYSTNNRSRAMYTFPVEKLTTDSHKTQPVKIPRPLPPTAE